MTPFYRGRLSFWNHLIFPTFFMPESQKLWLRFLHRIRRNTAQLQYVQAHYNACTILKFACK